MTAADPDMLLSFWSASAELYTAVSLLQRKDLDAGMALLTLGQEHMQQGGGRTMLSGLYAAAAQALVEAGALDAARRFLVQARTELATSWQPAYRPFVELAAAHLAAAEGDHEAAEEAIRLAAAVATEHESYGARARIARGRPAPEPSADRLSDPGLGQRRHPFRDIGEAGQLLVEGVRVRQPDHQLVHPPLQRGPEVGGRRRSGHPNDQQQPRADRAARREHQRRPETRTPAVELHPPKPASSARPAFGAASEVSSSSDPGSARRAARSARGVPPT